MTPETQRATTFANDHAGTITCPSCRAEMVRGMRFCRLCGFRLGEGLDEYVETMRLDGMPLMSQTQTNRQNLGANGATTTSLASRAAWQGRRRHRGRRMGWIGWVVFAAIFSSAMSGGVSLISSARRGGTRVHIGMPLMSRSFIGTQGFDYVRGEGVMLRGVLPGSPAELAGLLDGDTIQRFDGKNVTSEETMRDLLRRTPAGKTVEVAYLRDGVLMTTTLTTVASDNYDEKIFLPPGGASGYWGVDDLERAAVAGTNLSGVQLGNVSANRPADIAGLKAGDIVTEFDGKPVRTPDGLATYIHHAAPGSIIKIAVFRNGQRIELPVKMGRDN